MKLLTSLAFGLALTAGAQASTVYTNDFSMGDGGFTGAAVTTYGAYGAFYGILTQGATATLSLTGFAANQALELTFDLYTLQSLDGDNATWGPDTFAVAFNGSTVFDYSFSNWPGSLDAASDFPQSYGGIGSSAGTGAFASIESSGWAGATEYTYGVILSGLADANGDFQISFIGNSGQAAYDEGFGIDNVTVATVPLPAGLPLLAAGIGALGLLRRRKA